MTLALFLKSMFSSIRPVRLGFSLSVMLKASLAFAFVLGERSTLDFGFYLEIETVVLVGGLAYGNGFGFSFGFG
eukprot:838581-Amorphochlora_amoeboformis.AAC.1